MANIRTTTPRTVGGDFTVFQWMGKTLAYGVGIVDTGQDPLPSRSGQPYDIVHPLGQQYPSDIVTARAVSVGTLTITLLELWNGPAWQQLGAAAGLAGIASAGDIISIFEAQDAISTPITAQMLIKPPGSPSWRGWNYTGIKIVDVDQSENILIQTITVPRNVTCLYLRRTPLAMSATGPLTS